MPVPIPPTPVEKPSRFYYALEDNSAAAFAGPTGLAADNVFVNLDGVSIPKDHPHYPWRFDAAEGVVFTGSDGTNDPPPLNGNLEVGRNTSLNFNKIGFPQGYHTDAKVLNRVFTDGLLQSNELVDSADIANTAWADASAVPAPNEAQANDHVLLSDSNSEWQIRDAAWTRDKMLLDTDDDVRFTQCSSTDLSCILATDMVGGLPTITNNFWTPGTIYFSAVDRVYQTGDDKRGVLNWDSSLVTDTEVGLTKDGSTLILSSTSAVDITTPLMEIINFQFPTIAQNFDQLTDFRADASGNLRMFDFQTIGLPTNNDGSNYPPLITPSGNLITTTTASHWNTNNSTITARGNLSFPFYFRSAANQVDGETVTILKRAGSLTHGVIANITVAHFASFKRFKIIFNHDYTTNISNAFVPSIFTIVVNGHIEDEDGGDPVIFIVNTKVPNEKNAIYINPRTAPSGATPILVTDEITVRGWIHFHEDLI